MDSIKIGQFLKDLRIKDGLSQRDVAAICNVSHQAVSKWEKGGSVPDISSLQQLSRHYHITIDDILAGETKNNQPADQPFNNRNKEIIKITLSLFILLVGFLPFLQLDQTTKSGYELLYEGDFGLGIIVFVSTLAFVLFQLTFSTFIITRVISFSYSNISLNRSLSVIIMVLIWFSISISALFPFPFVLFFLYLVAIYLVNTKVIQTLDSSLVREKDPLDPYLYLGIYFAVLSILPVYLLFFDQWFKTVNLMVYPITIILFLTSVIVFVFSLWKRNTNTMLSSQGRLISVHTMRLLYLFFFYLMYTQSEFFNITENSYDSIMYVIIYIGFELFIHSKYTESSK